MKNFLLGLFAGFVGTVALMSLIATGYEEAFDKMVECWRSV